jgi:hypothetical protein
VLYKIIARMPAHQWKIIWNFAGEDSTTEIYSSFITAWLISQPLAPEDDPGWTYTKRADVFADFTQGGKTVRVAWRQDDGSEILIQKL